MLWLAGALFLHDNVYFGVASKFITIKPNNNQMNTFVRHKIFFWFKNTGLILLKQMYVYLRGFSYIAFDFLKM